VSWVKQRTAEGTDLRFVLEATGVYHESLAYFLHEQGYCLSIIMPSRISNFARTLSTKTITDKTASEAIAMFGLEKKLTDWVPAAAIYKSLRQLTRERDQLVQMRTIAQNHLHAEQAEARPDSRSIERMNQQIALFNKQEEEIMGQIREAQKSHEGIRRQAAILTSVPGIGILTATTILAETNGFELIRNKKQLTSYCGLDVKEKQSGTSVKGKPRISKKGNRYLRKAMYMPALTAVRCDERFKAIFARLISRHGINMKAYVAIQRKLLELAYTLYKNNTKYNPDYLKKLENSNRAVL